MIHFMVVCPVCGKYLKHFFALNGHMRLKGDDIHRIYFESHKMRYPKNDSNDIENKVQELISLVNKKDEDITKKFDDLIFDLKKLINIFSNLYEQSTLPIKQQDVKLEKPVIKHEKTDIKVEKIRTVAEIIKDYGSFENAAKYVDH